MVIGDDPNTLEHGHLLLVLQGDQSVTSPTSSQAVEQVVHHHPALVVLVVNALTRLPMGDILLAIRAVLTTAHIPVILYWAEHELLVKRGDACQVLRKPCIPDEPVRKVEALAAFVEQ